MAKITTITNPLTGQPAQVDQLDHTAQQIDDGLNIARGVSNPNLLDNWYFVNPVNQRGQTSYTGAGHGIDRWKIMTGTARVENGKIVLISGSGYQQLVDVAVNGEATLSILTESGLFAITGTLDQSVSGWQINKNFTGFFWMGVQYDSKGLLDIRITASADTAIKAIKLELGTQQTLAHQENGVWVLNEIPDYGEQLARCKRVYQRISSNGLIVLRQSNMADKFLIIKSFEVEMAGKPKLNLIKPIIVFTPITVSKFNGTALDTYATNSKGIQYAKIVSSVDLSNVQAGFVGYGDNNDDVIEAYVEGLGG